MSRRSLCLFVFLASLICLCCDSDAGETDSTKRVTDASAAWQKKAVEYARIMSRVKWTPVADGMPMRRGAFEAGTEYTGVPYSSVKHVGRYIGFDIFLKTFLAAVENPQSVLYTENLRGEVTNAECYYGNVCSSYTSYALQCGIWYVSRVHGPPYRNGVSLVQSQSAQATQVGDIIFTPPRPGSHIEIVTEVTSDPDGKVTHVRVEESWPRTTRNTNRTAAKFNSHIASRNRKLYRITDLDAWREGNRAESFLFPNYAEDSAPPTINRVLLLDRGDWVPYQKGQAVKFNVMDRDAQGVKTLVIKRGESVVEEIDRPGKGIIERVFPTCGDYTAHCVMQDDSLSQACEFSVCDLDFQLPAEEIAAGKSWDLEFSSDNMNIIIAYFRSDANSYAQPMVFLSDEDRKNGKVVISADLIQDKGKAEVWLIGENKYGRLKIRKEFSVK
ncbi:hypothetical protein [Roseimaritima multifibrata]|nr:hypothetical protein [Roseimaritima multifibrata]